MADVHRVAQAGSAVSGQLRPEVDVDVERRGVMWYYRLRTDTIAVHQEVPRSVAVVLPAGTILEVSDDPAKVSGFVDAECGGKRVQVFAIDLRDRGELVKARNV